MMPAKGFLKSFLISLVFLTISGCVFFSHYDEVMFMKGLSDSGKEIEQYLTKQERLFFRLKEDIIGKRLETGLHKSRIIELYGDPIFCKSRKAATGFKEECLFRHPSKYFNTDSVYLYFDQAQKLTFFELKRAQEK